MFIITYYITRGHATWFDINPKNFVTFTHLFRYQYHHRRHRIYLYRMIYIM